MLRHACRAWLLYSQPCATPHIGNDKSSNSNNRNDSDNQTNSESIAMGE